MQRTRKKNKHTLFLFCALSVSVLNFIVFWLYINTKTVIATFDPLDTFYYYKLVWEEIFTAKVGSAYEGIFGHTMISILINVIIFPIAFVTAYAFYKRVYGEKFFRVVFYLPSIIAITTLAMSFRSLFMTTLNNAGEIVEGPALAIFRLFGEKGQISLSNQALGDTSSFAYNNIWGLIIFFCVFTGLGTNVVLMCGAMMKIPVDITEALRIDGCGFFREMWSVSLPLIMPTITTWFIMIVTSVFGFSVTPMLVAGLTPFTANAYAKTNTIPLYIYSNICQYGGSTNMWTQSAQAAGVIFSLIMMPIVLLTRWLCEKLTPDVSY